MKYQTDGPFIVGQPTQVKLTECPEGYDVEWTIKYGNVTVEPMDTQLVTVTPLDAEPMQIFANCCKPSQADD